MRVIAGTFRSRRLMAPPGDKTRPTSDRLRETLFNILGARVPGARFADLYAGTGAVGIEAISRGAEHVFFAENAPPALKSLRANLAALKIAGGFAVEDRGTGALLQQLAGKGPVDLIFLDPPWEAENEYTGTLGLLGSATGAPLLAPGGLVVAEHATRSKFPVPDRFGTLTRTRLYRQGDASLSFYERPVNHERPENAGDVTGSALPEAAS